VGHAARNHEVVVGGWALLLCPALVALHYELAQVDLRDPIVGVSSVIMIHRSPVVTVSKRIAFKVGRHGAAFSAPSALMGAP
jgi:hypothetical protein